MDDNYKFKISECDVAVERQSALESFRAKRSNWVFWIDKDEHHAISKVISSMVWSDVSFRTLSHIAVSDDKSALHNSLIADSLINGHVATQILAIRRLMDDGTSGVVSLRKLLKDIRKNIKLFTRENFVCYDGLPYDYAVVQRRIMNENVGKGAFWGAKSGPDAYAISAMAHSHFDKLARINPANRKREDRLPDSLLKTIQSWLDDSVAEELASWSHVYLAHAGGESQRAKFQHVYPTLNKITEAIKILTRVSEALSLWILWSGGMETTVMPVALYDQFEFLQASALNEEKQEAAFEFWNKLSKERNLWLNEIEGSLFPHH